MPSTRQQTNAALTSELASARPSGISSSHRNSRAASSTTPQGNCDATSRGRDATPIGDASTSNDVHEVSSRRRLSGVETSPTMLRTPATRHPISTVDLATATRTVHSQTYPTAAKECMDARADSAPPASPTPASQPTSAFTMASFPGTDHEYVLEPFSAEQEAVANARSA